MTTIEKEERIILDNAVMIANQLQKLQEMEERAAILTFEAVLQYLNEKYEEMKS